MRIKSALAPLGVFHVNRYLRGVEPLAVDAFTHANRPNQPQSRRRAKQLAFYQQSLFAIVVNDEIGGSIAILRVNILPPKMLRFQHMAVRINNVIRASHSFPPLHCCYVTFSSDSSSAYCK